MTSSLDIGDPPHPTDREREIALGVGRVFENGQGRAVLLTAMARALAAYRAELLEQQGERERAYQLVECELRDRRVASVRLESNFASVLVVGEPVTRSASSLRAAVDVVRVLARTDRREIIRQAARRHGMPTAAGGAM